MIHLKSEQEINIMQEGGVKLRRVVKTLLSEIKPEMTTEEIDKRAEELILKEGAEPSFKRVKGYSWSTCLPINEQVVHTPPSTRLIKDGDVLTLDIGIYHKGFNVDWATTFIVGKPKDSRHIKFLEAGRQALKQAIEKAKSGRYLGEISETIEKEIYKYGFFILKELTGHGVGKELHEDPYIPGYINKPVNKTLKMEPGLTLAIEVIYSSGTEEIAYENGNDWSVVTRDGSMSACFEETVGVLENKSFILT